MKPRVAPLSVIGHVADIVACLELNVDQSVLERRPVKVAEAFWKRDEVAITVGTAEALVWLAQRELAAMEAKEIEAAAPPICAPSVPELVRPVPTESVVVATP